MFKKSYMLLMIFIFTGCTKIAEGPLFKKENLLSEEKAIVYIYRPIQPVYDLPVLEPTIFVNGKPIFRLPRQGYGVLFLDKGKYEFETRKENDTISVEAESKKIITIDSLKNYYIKWHPIYIKTTMIYSYPYSIPTTEYIGNFELLEEQEGLQEILEMRKIFP